MEEKLCIIIFNFVNFSLVKSSMQKQKINHPKDKRNYLKLYETLNNYSS